MHNCGKIKIEDSTTTNAKGIHLRLSVQPLTPGRIRQGVCLPMHDHEAERKFMHICTQRLCSKQVLVRVPCPRMAMPHLRVCSTSLFLKLHCRLLQQRRAATLAFVKEPLNIGVQHVLVGFHDRQSGK